MAQLVKHTGFHAAVLSLLLLNCVFLALHDPTREAPAHTTCRAQETSKHVLILKATWLSG